MNETANNLVRDAVHLMGHVPTAQQGRVLSALSYFITSRQPNDVMVINGFAGTGKTTVVGAMVEAMKNRGLKTVLLAPTGRAAKVASSFSKGKASTIHRHIYRLAEPAAGLPSDTRNVQLATNYNRNTVYFVDEASMITHSPASRSLLYDLLKHVYGPRQGNAVVFIGDTAQLPPVGQTNSPAMDHNVLKGLGLNTLVMEMDEILRQSAESGILFNATKVRKAIGKELKVPPTLKISPFDDIKVISSAELADHLADSWAKTGSENTLLITRSNWRANRYNDEIRRRVLYSESPIEQGERLIIAKNNYFWTRNIKEVDFLANGDTVTVNWVGKPEKMYGRYFVDVELDLPEYATPLAAKIMLRSLRADGPAIPTEEMDKFYAYIMSQHEGELTEKMAAADSDPYFNALQVKYAYSVTCHKAQGGQWEHVYIDMAGIAQDAMDDSFYRWLYTAMTRATSRLYIINPTLEWE